MHEFTQLLDSRFEICGPVIPASLVGFRNRLIDLAECVEALKICQPAKATFHKTLIDSAEQIAAEFK